MEREAVSHIMTHPQLEIMLPKILLLDSWVLSAPFILFPLLISAAVKKRFLQY